MLRRLSTIEAIIVASLPSIGTLQRLICRECDAARLYDSTVVMLHTAAIPACSVDAAETSISHRPDHWAKQQARGGLFDAGASGDSSIKLFDPR